MTVRNNRLRPLVCGIVCALGAGMAVGATAAPDPGPQQATASATATDATPPAKSKKQPRVLQTVVVTGIRGSQEHSIELKRMAPSIQDSITAEGIGQLPDFTIADSLSRIPGVQINRSVAEGAGNVATGEGSTVEVRGLPQAGVTLNGESFLTPDQIVSQQPNFQSVPSSLFAGADVIKTPTASMTNAGITGTINLRTWRPLDLKQGITLSYDADVNHGVTMDKYQPEGNALFSYNDGGKWGVLIGATYSKIDHSNNGFGVDNQGGDIFGESPAAANLPTGFIGAFRGAGVPVPPGIVQLPSGGADVNGNGTDNDAFFGPARAAFASQNQLNRTRSGVNASAQYKFGDGFTFTADAFMNRLRDTLFSNNYEMYPVSNNNAGFVPLVSTATGGQVVPTKLPAGSPAENFYSTQVYEDWPGDIESYAIGQLTNSVAHNYNLELSYDHGGPFTADVRFVNGTASQQSSMVYTQFTNSNGAEWTNSVDNPATYPLGVYPTPNGSGLEPLNANGMAPMSTPIVYSVTGNALAVTLPPSLLTQMSNRNDWVPKLTASDGQNYFENAGSHVARVDGHYTFQSGVGPFELFKFDFGLRNSIRTASEMQFYRVPVVFGGQGASDPNGCATVWAADDLLMDGGGVAGACTAGNQYGFYHGNPFVGLPQSQWPSAYTNNFQEFTNIGASTGTVMWGLNPKAESNPVAFFNSVYPNSVISVIPSASWNLALHTTTGYLQWDFGGDIGSVSYIGNIGYQRVRSELKVTHYDASSATEAYGLNPPVVGTDQVNRVFYDNLPSFNIDFGLTDQLHLRMAFSRNMMPLDLDQWGGGSSISYGFVNQNGVRGYVPLGGSSTGNAELNPWRSKNYDMNLAYYTKDGGVISVDAFFIKVASFIENAVVSDCTVPVPATGVPNGCIPFSTEIQGTGRSLKGGEFEYQQALTFLPGLLANTGVTFNATYAPSTAGGHDMAGRQLPFQGNSKKSANLILWYQGGPWQARIADNYRSREAVVTDFANTPGTEQYLAPSQYIDASIAYSVNKHLQIYLQGSNITNQSQRYYITYASQLSDLQLADRTYELGFRGRF